MKTSSRERSWRGRWGAALILAALTACCAGEIARARGPMGEEKIYAYQKPYLFRHNVGLLELAITNIGVIGDPWVNEYAAGWRGGEYLYAAALWVGAIASDNLAHVSTGAYETEFRPSLDIVDTIYPSYEGAAGGNRPGFSASPDDDHDGEIDEDPLNGKDDDGDGPGVGLPCPAGVKNCDEDFSAISQQMFACEYWDFTDEARAIFPDHRPLNLKVHQESYAWSTEGANEFVGFDFKITNVGFELLRQVYLGFFVDSDAGPKDHQGYFNDDRGAYTSIDTTFTDLTINYQCSDLYPGGGQRNCAVQKLHLDVCYMYDVPDDGESAKGGDVAGFFGGMFLGHTTDPSGETAPRRVEIKTARFFSGANAYPAGDPSNDTERYDLLQSGIKQQRPTGVPDDFRYCISAGPFKELAPGAELLFQVAFVIGEGKQGMLTNALNAQRIYNGKWRDVDGNTKTGVGGKETCLKALDPSEPVVWKDPCDSVSITTITVKETVCIADNYVDNDCDCCTPLFQNATEAATSGLETLVHWVGTVAPPPPGTNMDPQGPNTRVTAPAGDRKVIVEWDNLSELTADPIQQRILFTGYRVWRVESWKRPVGSAGPAPEDWQLVADLSLNPPDRQGSDSPSYLKKFENKDIDSLYPVNTGSTVHGEEVRWYYPVGKYAYVDALGLKNGMIYFYDVTAYSAWVDPNNGNYFELGSRPAATEADGVVPVWGTTPLTDLGGIYVVPNPYIQGKNPDGWDLEPSRADPTGTKLAFVGLPAAKCTIRIYTLAGDLVQTLEHDGQSGGGATFWNLISRNGQDIVSGVYLYSVDCGKKNKIGRFVVVR